MKPLSLDYYSTNETMRAAPLPFTTHYYFMMTNINILSQTDRVLESVQHCSVLSQLSRETQKVNMWW